MVFGRYSIAKFENRVSAESTSTGYVENFSLSYSYGNPLFSIFFNNFYCVVYVNDCSFKVSEKFPNLPSISAQTVIDYAKMIISRIVSARK